MTICTIIGHGPSPSGRGWGREIDASDIVVRMFDCHWQDAADYGVRYDWGVYVRCDRHYRWFSDIWKAVPVRMPTQGWFEYQQAPYGPDCRLPGCRAWRDLRHEKAYALEMGAKTLGANFAFTRGTAAALIAFQAIAEVPDLILVGFDEVRTARYSPKPYSPALMADMVQRADMAGFVEGLAARDGTEQRSLGHDLTVEMPVIMKMAEAYGVTVKHADEVWS